MKDTPEPLAWRTGGYRARYRPIRRLARGLVDAAPWLNVTLLVILYLFLTAPYVLQPGIVIQLPTGPFADGRPYGTRLAIISQESPEPGMRDEIAFFDDERFLVRDTNQMAALRLRLGRVAKDRPAASLIVEADQRVLHGTIIAVFNMAADAGIREINVATRPGH